MVFTISSLIKYSAVMCKVGINFYRNLVIVIIMSMKRENCPRQVGVVENRCKVQEGSFRYLPWTLELTDRIGCMGCCQNTGLVISLK